PAPPSPPPAPAPQPAARTSPPAARARLSRHIRASGRRVLRRWSTQPAHLVLTAPDPAGHPSGPPPDRLTASSGRSTATLPAAGHPHRDRAEGAFLELVVPGRRGESRGLGERLRAHADAERGAGQGAHLGARTGLR